MPAANHAATRMPPPQRAAPEAEPHGEPRPYELKRQESREAAAAAGAIGHELNRTLIPGLSFKGQAAATPIKPTAVAKPAAPARVAP
eukprot:5576280-Prymnesium_polylepis.1